MRICIILCFFITYAVAGVNVLVSVAPQKGIVESIAQKNANITILVPNGKSPELYEPSISQMKQISGVDVFFGVGLPLESKWLQKFQSINKNILYVDLSKDRYFAYTQHNKSLQKAKSLTRHHTEQGEVSNKSHNDNPHIWLGFTSVAKSAEIITDTLSKLDSNNSKIYESNKKNLLEKIKYLKKQSKELFNTTNTKEFIIFHPSFDLFADELNLTQISLEIEGKELKAQHLKNIIDSAKKNNLKSIFIQTQYAKNKVQAIANELNLNIIQIDILDTNWLLLMAKNACQIAYNAESSQIESCIKENFSSIF